MRGKRLLIWLLAGILCLTFSSCRAEGTEAAAPADDIAEWSVLFYFCGSDLESKHGYATGNLLEMMETSYPESYMLDFMSRFGANTEQMTVHQPGKVNVLIETGGCSEWHSQKLGMDITSEALQRWRLDFERDPNHLPEMVLEDTIPLSAMSKPDTLSDFIRWSTRNYPAKKYALVLWDHGGGALTGLFSDELYENDYMDLDELKHALADGGVVFEAVVIDACLMANIETAYAVKDSARWLIASEEEVPGTGTAVKDWLQELFVHPEADGRILGRNICDMTMAKYANDDNQQARTTLTWSVVDMSRIEPLIEAMDHYFRMLCDTYQISPRLVLRYAYAINKSEEYGSGEQKMRDIAGVLFSDVSMRYMDLSLRNEMLDALSDAVNYTVRGIGRSGARGLSFCYPVNASIEKLESYAKNCPSMYYLAFLDAVTGWTAPDKVYETAERLPEIESVADLRATVEKCRNEKGFPVISVTFIDAVLTLDGVYYHLYRLDEGTGQVMSLGRTDCIIRKDDEEKYIVEANEPWMWPSIDDAPCTMELLVEQFTSAGTVRLYNIPVQIGTDDRFLRCGRTDPFDSEDKHEYEVYGVWEMFDDNSQMTNRNVITLPQLAGQEYRLIAPMDLPTGQVKYMISGPSGRLFRVLDVVEKPLPTGTYYMEYEIEDMFMRRFVTERFEISWDGEKMTVPDDYVWDGNITLTWSNN